MCPSQGHWPAGELTPPPFSASCTGKRLAASEKLGLLNDVGIVVIGRNEGERLAACLRSIGRVAHCVYVDSGSTDGSLELARSLGVDAIPLVCPPKFSAARARNTGAHHLRQELPDIRFVQMIDGDCVLDHGWLDRARTHLLQHQDRAAVFGRRRERFPEASPYNRMCDEEWAVQPGLVSSCGGDVMFRAAAFEEVGGFNNELVAGEEPELCYRLRRKGWTIECIDAAMTVHDVALYSFGGWWTRARRAGFAFAELMARYGQSADGHWVQLVTRAAVWSAIMLLALVGLVLGGLGGITWLALAGALLLLLVIAKTASMAWRLRAGRSGLRWALTFSTLLMISKLAQFQGVLQSVRGRLRGSSSQLIEYKSAA